jgi:Tol biopolymer transport system component
VAGRHVRRLRRWLERRDQEAALCARRSSENPRFIETIPRRGYRFIAPVVVETAERTATAPEISPAAGSRANRMTLWTAAVILALAAVPAIFFSASYARRTNPGAPRVMPVTTLPGYEQQPAFSPDGSRLAFVWDGDQEKNNDIYIKVLDAPTMLRLTTHPRTDVLPAWSPDGQRLAFARNLSPDRYDVLLIPAVGGPEQRIASFFIVEDLDWSPDGHELAIAKRDARDAPASIVLLRLATREVRQLTRPSESRGDERLAFSPDGRTLALMRRSPNAMGIFVIPAGGGEPRQVLTEPGGAHDLAWTPDGRYILFSSGPGRAALWRVPAGGGPRERLSSAGDSIRSFSIARSGDRIAFTHLTGDVNIWQFSPDNGSSVATPTPLVVSTQHDTAPDPSPDGRKLAFISDRSGTQEIWTCDADGNNAIVLTSFGGPHVGTPHWSPDGRRIAFSAYPEGLSDVFLVDAEGGPPRPLVTEPSDDIPAGWSADGRWVYFASTRTGRRELWKVPAAGGSARQVTYDGAFQAAESADGTTLYFSKRDAPGIWKMPAAGGAAELVVDDFKPGFWGGWRLMPDGLYFLADGSPRTIRFFSFRTRRQTHVMTLDRTPDYAGGAFTVLPDRRILISLLDQEGSDIKLLENFR